MKLQSIIERIWTRNYFSVFLTIWTALITASVAWNLYENHEEIVERARIEARTIFQHNLAYRRWNTMHGGVYAEITDENRPNPFIVSPLRDLSTREGVKLTLINPFQMTKQTYELLRKQSPLASINRTVSMKPLNPENIPDEWERKALSAFEKGRTEVSEITEINGSLYMRVLEPYRAEKRCLKCHGHQGYKEGDIRGGMSIAVPMRPYYEAALPTGKIIVLTHIALWLMGAGALVLFSRGLRRYQSAISESERKFRIVSEFAYDFELWIGEDGEIVFISPSCERITGYSRQEFVENPGLLSDIVHPDDREAYKNHLADFRSSSHGEMEIRIITKSGQQKWLSHSCRPILVEGKFLGRRASNRDVTDNKRLEDQLFQSQKMESLGHFAGGVAHDFNNVLTAINGFAYLLNENLKEGASNDDSRECIDRIFLAVKLGKNLTSNLLASGRKQIANPMPVELSLIIHKISDILKTLVTEEIELKIALSDDEMPIIADPHQIGQVIINLCTNAKDAMPAGGEIEIKTGLLLLDQKYTGRYSTIPPGTYMVLSISDTGSGIDADKIDHIFEPFFTTKQNGKGTGLGLTIVYSVVRQHNGFIDVRSERNKGTTFTIVIPASKQHGDEIAGPPLPEPRYITRGHETILLAEDEASVRKFLERLLQRRGYTVILAEDGEDAMKKYHENRDGIDMVIFDVVLPRKNGREVYDEIKSQKHDIKALFISGYTDDIITEKGIFEEKLEFLSKPLDAQTFVMKVRDILHKQ